MDAQKKTLGATERNEEDRGAWRSRLSSVDPERLVFVDECSTNVRMTPLRARAPRGERAIEKAPKNWKENVTLISSITERGMGPSMSIEGSADGEAFVAYVERLLCPSLKRSQIVIIMDNLKVHKMKRVRELIEERGCRLVFLPAYSPDFNPIEEAFSKVKTLLRKAKARGVEALDIGHRRSALDGKRRGCPRLLRPQRLREVEGSFVMKIALIWIILDMLLIFAHAPHMPREFSCHMTDLPNGCFRATGGRWRGPFRS